MKIGIISDIHGDILALKTVLYRFDELGDIDMILCAGDLVGRGEYPNEVVSLIRERNIIAVRGNHDQMPYSLTTTTAEYLRDLPIEWRGTYEGVSLYMCHGKPGSTQWGMYHEHLSTTLVNMMLTSLDVDIYITGSTHVPMFMCTDKGCVINSGSLFLFNHERQTSRTYGVLTLPEKTFDVHDLKVALSHS